MRLFVALRGAGGVVVVVCDIDGAADVGDVVRVVALVVVGVEGGERGEDGGFLARGASGGGEEFVGGQVGVSAAEGEGRGGDLEAVEGVVVVDVAADWGERGGRVRFEAGGEGVGSRGGVLGEGFGPVEGVEVRREVVVEEVGGDLFGVVVVFVEELDDECGPEVWEEILDLSHEA